MLYATTRVLIMAYFWCIGQGRFIFDSRTLFDIISTQLNVGNMKILHESPLPTSNPPPSHNWCTKPRSLTPFLLALGEWKGGQKVEGSFSIGSCTQNKVGGRHPAWPMRNVVIGLMVLRESEEHRHWTHTDLSLPRSFRSAPHSALHGCGMIYETTHVRSIRLHNNPQEILAIIIETQKSLRPVSGRVLRDKWQNPLRLA